MKRLIISLVLTFVCSASFSQSDNIWKRKPWETLKKENLSTITQGTNLPKDDTAVKEISPFVLKLETRMNKIRATGPESDLYLVEPYKMPCVAPAAGFTSKMPVMGNGEKLSPGP